jgi:hypothetical protein
LNKTALNQTTCLKGKGKHREKGKDFNNIYGRGFMEGMKS